MTDPATPCPSQFPIDIEAGQLAGVWAHVAAAAGDSKDQTLIAEDLDSAQYGIATDVMLLLELFHGRQRAVAPLAFGDPGPEDGS